MSKIAPKLVEEMQLSWDYGQGFHTYSITDSSRIVQNCNILDSSYSVLIVGLATCEEGSGSEM